MRYPCATVLHRIETKGSTRSLGSQAIQRRREGLVVLMHHRQESGRDGGGGRPASRQPALLCASLPKMKA